MICDDVRPLLAQRPLELLEGAEATALDAHLANCSSCQADVETLEGCYAAISDTPSAEVPEDLWGKIAAEVADGGRGASTQPKAPNLSIALCCTFCHDGLARADATFCATCLAPHHGECFTAHGRCSAPGCDETHTVRPHLEVHPGGRTRRWLAPAIAVGALIAGAIGAAAYADYTAREREHRAGHVAVQPPSVPEPRPPAPTPEPAPPERTRPPGFFPIPGALDPESAAHANTGPRVLVLDGHARYEFRYLQRALTQGSFLRAETFLTRVGSEANGGLHGAPPRSAPSLDADPSQTPTLQSLPALETYDVVVLGDLADPALVERLDVARFVTDGGGLILLPGQDGLATQGATVSALAPLLDARLDPDTDGVNTFHVASPGHPSMAALRTRGAVRGDLRALLGVRPAQLREGATSLLEGPDARPLIATWVYGRGKVIGLASDQFWRWHGSTPTTYRRFWTDLVVWAGIQAPLGEEARIDLDVKNLPLRAVAEQIGAEVGHTIVVDPNVDEVVSVRLDDIPWGEALQILARMTRCSLEEHGGAYVFRQPPLITISRHEASVRTVLELLASHAGRAIEFGPGVAGQAAVEVRGLTWEDAMRKVCAAADLSLDLGSDPIRVATRTDEGPR